VRVRGLPEPKTIRDIPEKDNAMLCHVRLSTFSVPRIELKRDTNMGVVARIREEFTAVVRNMPCMKRTW